MARDINEKPKKKKSKGVVIALTILCMVMLAFVLTFAIGVISYLTSKDEFDIDMIELNMASTVYYTDANGNSREYQRINQAQNRIWVDIDDVSPYLQDAFVAIEDERFYSHGGVDLPRTMKATAMYVFKGSSSFGGSTITQQLVKNITGDKAERPDRKIREMFRAVQLEKKLSKQQILETYLNTIYLSNNCYGVQAASKMYFGCDAKDLTLAQSASIAGITQYPSYYDPVHNPENNITKQRVVLSKMLELGKISQEEYDRALEEKLDFESNSIASFSNIQSYFTDNLINEVISDLQTEKGYTKEYAEQILFNGGLKIYSTVDPDVQKTMEKYYENTSNFPSNYPKGANGEAPQSAMVVLDTETGAVKGVVGGLGKKTQNRILNRATQIARQPGSTMKPIGVYAPAVEKEIISSSTQIQDKKISYGDWTPKNYYPGFKGWVTARTALKQSMNTPAIQVLDELGVDYSYKFLSDKLGISTLVKSEVRNGNTYSDKNLSSLALGGLTDGIRPIELAAAYAAFGNNGVYNKAYSYESIVDNDGNVIISHKKDPKVAMSESTACIMCDMLKSVIEDSDGTGYGTALSNGMPAGAKTGTTDNDNDLWYVGFTPYYSAVVWYGYDTPRGLSWRSFHPCKNAWHAVMNEISKNQTKKEFNVPDSVTSVKVCQTTGMLPSSECKTRYSYFAEGTEPTKRCSGHGSFGSLTPTEANPDTPSKTTEDGKSDTEKADTEATGDPLKSAGNTDKASPSEGTAEIKEQAPPVQTPPAESPPTASDAA